MSFVSTTHLREIMVSIEELERRAGAAPLGQHMLIDPADLLEIINELRVSQAAVRIVARHAVAAVEASGQVITVERQALAPLAMGHHAPLITFRPKRVPA
jgi:hypothetical protein